MTEQQEKQGTDLGTLWRMFRHRRGVIILCFAVTAGVALLFSLAQQKQYSASASLLFRDPQLDQKLFGSTYFAPQTDPQLEAATNTKLVSLAVIATQTSHALRGQLAPADIRSKVSVAQEGQSNVVSITATDPNPRLAASIANTFAEQYTLFRQHADRSKIRDAQLLVQRQLNRLGPKAQYTPDGRSLRSRAEQLQILASLQTGNAELVQRASTPSSPSSPKPLRNTVLGGVLGFLFGLGLAVLLERLDRRLKDPKEVGELFDRPVLGAIPVSRAISDLDKDPRRLGSGEAEAFRMLRANLRYFNVDDEITSVLITSSAPADGKSTVAMHLAIAAAAAGGHVLLMEADLRNPTLARRMRLDPNRGLSQILAGDASSPSDVTHRVPVAGRRGEDNEFRTLDVVVSGPIPPNPTDLIESERMTRVIQAAQDSYDLVVIDTPPTSVVSDAIPLVKKVSGVLVVCRLGRTTRDSATHLKHQLENLDANTLGVVLNAVGRQAGYYGYGYAYAYDGGRGRSRYGGGTPIPGPVSLGAGDSVGDGETGVEGRQQAVGVVKRPSDMPADSQEGQPGTWNGEGEGPAGGHTRASSTRPEDQSSEGEGFFRRVRDRNQRDRGPEGD
jgi:tyrosine-protein kinase